MDGGYEGPSMTAAWALWGMKEEAEGGKELWAAGHYYWEKGRGAFHAEALAMHLGLRQLRVWIE
eukprot:1603433-Lingulodinium_polyedra.AAC.1